MRRRWILTIAVAIALVAGVRIALDAVNGSSSPSSPALAPMPGVGPGSAVVKDKTHCVRVLSTGLRRRVRQSLSARQRRALPPTIGAVCETLPATTRLEVAAQEVLTIIRSH